MNPLEARKQLLIAESELNRTQLSREWEMLAGGIRALAKQVETISVIATSAASLVGVLSALRRKSPTPTGEKFSSLQTILKYVPIAGALWSKFRTHAKSQTGQPSDS